MKFLFFKVIVVIQLLTLSLHVFSAGPDEENESGSFGAGNGGDGVILPVSSTVDPLSLLFWDTDTVHAYRSWEKEGEDENILGTYLLDFVELGIENLAQSDFCSQKSFAQYRTFDHTIRVNDRICDVTDFSFFQKMMEYQGIFGQFISEGHFSFFKNFGSFLVEKNDTLSSLQKEISTLFDESDTLHDQIYEFKCSDYEHFSELQCKELREQIHSIDRQIASLRHEFDNQASMLYPNMTEDRYSYQAYLALGIINKIEQIRKIDSEFADSVRDVLLQLEWEVLDLELNEINDEGNIIPKINRKIQMANRSLSIVRISNLGWTRMYKGGNNQVLPMDLNNKLGLIFHEVFSEMRMRRGDVDSRIARLATGYLFKSNNSRRYIEKVISLMSN